MVHRLIVVPTLVALVLTGCSTVDSADIKTSGITAGLLVTMPEGANSVDVSASLRVGTLTFVELGGGEQLTATGDGKTVTLKRRKVAGATSYVGRLDGVSQPGTEITFALQRDGDNKSAPSSTVTLPEPVQLTAPAAGTRFSRRADVDVRFTNGPPAVLTWAGQCIQSGSLELEAGRTSATISRGTVKATPTPPSAGTKASDTCQVSLTLTRRTEGKLDQAFKNGVVAAESQSVRQVVSAP